MFDCIDIAMPCQLASRPEGRSQHQLNTSIRRGVATGLCLSVYTLYEWVRHGSVGDTVLLEKICLSVWI